MVWTNTMEIEGDIKEQATMSRYIYFLCLTVQDNWSKGIARMNTSCCSTYFVLNAVPSGKA